MCYGINAFSSSDYPRKSSYCPAYTFQALHSQNRPKDMRRPRLWISWRTSGVLDSGCLWSETEYGLYTLNASGKSTSYKGQWYGRYWSRWYYHFYRHMASNTAEPSGGGSRCFPGVSATFPSHLCHSAAFTSQEMPINPHRVLFGFALFYPALI